MSRRARPTLSRPVDAGELQRLLDRLVAAGAPGAAAWVQDEHGGLPAASGVADRRTGRPMRPGLHFRAGSVTKTLVATVVLQLVAETRLSLDDPVAGRLPGLLPYGDRATIGQLLNHTGGVPDHAAVVAADMDGPGQGRLRAWAPRELVALVADRPPSFPPGTGWSYSNTGYVLLGQVVEAATGNRLGQELDRRIFRPLRLRHSVFPVNTPGIPSPMSRGYRLPPGPQADAPGDLLDVTFHDPSHAWAAGALVSCLQDLAWVLRALLRGGLLPPRLLAEMLTAGPVPPGSLPAPLYDGYGLGLAVFQTPAGLLVGHPGGIPGFSTVVVSTPDGHRQLGIMVNVGDRAPAPVSEVFLQGYRALGTRLLGSG